MSDYHPLCAGYMKALEHLMKRGPTPEEVARQKRDAEVARQKRESADPPPEVTSEDR